VYVEQVLEDRPVIGVTLSDVDFGALPNCSLPHPARMKNKDRDKRRDHLIFINAP
jgi:hypothetical protein